MPHQPAMSLEHPKNSPRAWKEGEKTFDRICNTLFSSAAEGIVVTDHEGMMRMVNPRAEEMFGYTSAEMLGQKVELLVTESARNQHTGEREQYMRQPARRSMGIGMDLEARRKDGSTFPVEISLNHFEVDGEAFAMALITDITLRKHAEKELARLTAAQDTVKALEKERKLNELKSRFVSMASHEFRTPLSTILTSLSLLSRYEGPAQEEYRQKHYNRIRASVHNLTAILNDFLSLDKLESGRLSAHIEDIDLPDMLEDVVDEMQNMCKEGQRIEFSFEGDPKVTTDRHMLRNIILNLISNAIKYSGNGKLVEVTAIVANEKIHVNVRDHGIGIPEADKEHMFERFFRANNAINIQGTGLGLNIVKRYLDLLGGEIAFESQVGKGTTFRIALPQKLAI
jgi:PAS domain S-box-containing protein